ncbi:MAG: glycosyltransferase [Bacteroidales bacterium]|nr:glycosyltransferase [Bacteroidales bacterium]
MKILETITDLNLSSGGAVTSTLNSYGLLRDRGIDIDMVTLLPYSDDDSYLGDSYDGINALPFDGKTQFVYSKNLKRFLEKNRGYDIYHANGIWTYPTYKTIQVARKEDKPCIVTIHGMLNKDALKMTSFKKQIFLKLFQKRHLQSVAYIHATSEYEAECIRELGITTPIAVIPNGVIDCKLKHSFSCDGIVRFGFVGRTDPVKNIDVLLSAWQKLGNYTKNCQLTIIGGGNDSEYSKKLHTFVSEHNMNNVAFTGL